MTNVLRRHGPQYAFFHTENPERTHIASDNRELRKRTQGAQLLTNSPALHANQFQVQVCKRNRGKD